MIVRNIPEGKGRIAYAAQLIAEARSANAKPAPKKVKRDSDGTVRIREWHEGDEQEKEVRVTLNQIYQL